MGRVELRIFRHFKLDIEHASSEACEWNISTLFCDCCHDNQRYATNLRKNVVQAVIPPMLNESNRQWSYRGTRSVLFVGATNFRDHDPFRQSTFDRMALPRSVPQLPRIEGIRINIYRYYQGAGVQ